MKKNHCFVVIFLIITMGCTKLHDNYDYRTLYIGEFSFTTILNGFEMCYYPSATCIDGWTLYGSDTTFLKTNVELKDTNRLIIVFGNDIIGIHDNGDTLTQAFEPILLDGGELLFAEFPQGGHNHFYGHYQGYDTILMDFQFGYGIGAYAKYEVIGIRIY